MTVEELCEPVRRLQDAFDVLAKAVVDAKWKLAHGDPRGAKRVLEDAQAKAKNIRDAKP